MGTSTESKPQFEASTVYIKKPGVQRTPDVVFNEHQMGGRKDLSRLFGRVPASVLLDPRLTAGDKEVYAAMALHTWGSNVCQESLRVLATMIAGDHTHVLKSAKRLVEAGHIAKEGRQRKGSRWVLLSPVFSTEVPVVEEARKRVRCCDCGKIRRGVAITGRCRACAHAVGLERKVARILKERPEATQEQVYLAVKSRNHKGIASAYQKLKTGT